jgi:signal transduction histidine kinase
MQLGIRARIILLAVLPVCFATVLTTVILVNDRLDHEKTELGEVGNLLVRQLASQAEFGLFSGNRDFLETMAAAALSERDVTTVVIRDGRGEAVVALGDRRRVGGALALADAVEGQQWSGDSVRIVQLVRRSPSDVFDELFATTPGEVSPPIGVVEVTMTFDTLRRDARRIGLWSAAIAAAIAALALTLALRFGERLSGPLRRLAAAVERIGGGDFSARVRPESGSDLGRLAEGVNRMAERLAASRADLQRQVDEATQELSMKKREAEQASEAKSRFLAAASHDLRQPMHALALFADQLGRQPLKGEAAVLAERIRQASDSLAALLDSLLDLSRLDAGAVVPRCRVLALAPLFGRLAAEYGETAREKGLRLRVRPTALWIDSDPQMCERILANLLSNAIRYTRRGTVLLAARRRGSAVRIEVRDSGVGIPEASQALVFSEFVQLANPERDQRKGLGLGLSIVARLCALLNHPLGLRSRAGEGSLFWFEAPAAAAQPLVDDAVIGSTLARRLIAIVEDDPAILAGMRDQLAAWGCASVGAVSADELVGRLQGEGIVPDALICDHQGTSAGCEAAEAIQLRLGYALPVVVVSADAALQAKARARGTPVLTKPVRPAKLRAALEALLGPSGSA